MLKRLLTVALAACWTTTALAADGDPCSTSATYYKSTAVGRMVPIWCVVLCDATTTETDRDCSAGGGTTKSFDLKTVGGVPDLVAFELHEIDANVSGGAGDCSAGTITINTSNETGLTTASENAYDIGSTTALTVAGTNRILLDTKAAPLDRYVYATTSGLDANCANDGVDILMIGYEEKKTP